jgi:flagella basal body P-ring formation protein FlgA
VASREVAPGQVQVVATGDPRGDSHTAANVQVLGQADSTALLGRHSFERVASGEAVDPTKVDSVILVQPGKPTTLRLLSGSMRMLLEVIPLERGVLGQKIRVRLPATGKVLQGQVVGAGRLEAAF